MGTNGVLITEAVADRMIDCGVKGVGISIDSVNPERHDTFRGGSGSWEHSVKALEICKARGLEVLVQSTVMEENAHEVPALLDFAQSKGAWSFNLYFLVQTGRGRTMTELSAAQTEELLEDLVGQQEAYRPMLVRSKCAPQFKRIAYEQGKGGLESGGCMAGSQYCRITPSGDVTPCPYMTVSAGNVRESSFTEIWTRSPVLEALRHPERYGGRCGECEYNRICGGCRCRAYARFGDELAEDPACPHEPTGEPLEILELEWSEEARARIERIPIRFIRNKVEQGVRSYAQAQGLKRITPDVLKEAMAGAIRPPAFQPPAAPPEA